LTEESVACLRYFQLEPNWDYGAGSQPIQVEKLSLVDIETPGEAEWEFTFL
jgi:hypothetical protein